MKRCICIRREDKNTWEKRSPLIPTHVRELIQEKGLDICVQSSLIRVFSDQEFIREGARVIDDIDDCEVIIALKEIPTQVIKEDKIYMFFSHTVKGQRQNIPMLKRLKELRCTLIDYEKIMDEDGQRLIFFGVHAGQAGMIETLSSLGRRLSYEGLKNPFEAIQQPFQYKNLLEAKEQIEIVGWKIHENGLNRSLVPLICGFMGYGHTSQGAQELYDLLPVEEIKPKDLADFVEGKNYSAHKVYKVVFKEEDIVQPVIKDTSFNLQDYYQNPQKYHSIFSTYLPYMTVLMNCVHWEPRYPRFVTNENLGTLFSENEAPRLRIIGDISCDLQGSIECTIKVTTPDNPVYIFNPVTGEIRDDVTGRGVVIMSIDNLPAEIPLESSAYFSGALKPFIQALAQADYSGNFAACTLPTPIKNAVILFKGKFTPKYQHMKDFLST